MIIFLGVLNLTAQKNTHPSIATNNILILVYNNIYYKLTLNKSVFTNEFIDNSLNIDDKNK